MISSPEKITCIIVDDTPVQIEILTEDLNSIPNIEIVLSTTNPVEAYTFLSNHPVDVVFLDMQMPVITGMDILSQFGNKVNFIIMTAYRDYGVDTHQFYGVIDYILKPVSMTRLLKALDKLQIRLKEQQAFQKSLLIHTTQIISQEQGSPVSGQEKAQPPAIADKIIPNNYQLARQELYSLKLDLLTATNVVTGMEKAILQVFPNGLSNKQIADRFNISDRTAAKHIQNIFRKLGVSSKEEAITHILSM